MESPSCPVLEFAASGAMWLTGEADGPPAVLEAPLVGALRAACEQIAFLSGQLGERVVLDPALVLTERAARRGFRRSGRTSLNGSCRLLRAPDGWLAVNLARPSDLELLPAVLHPLAASSARRGPVLGAPARSASQGSEPPADQLARREEAWALLERAAWVVGAHALVERAQLVGIAAAVLPSGPSVWPRAVRLVPFGRGRPGARQWGARPMVVDFSALWAGPLCAFVLGAAGARVVKVEDPARPDPARGSDPALFDRLHGGHELVAVGFRSEEGRRRLRELVEEADIVIEASRPRALEHLGLSPARFLAARTGRSWVSITGYGRHGPYANRVAFGDDAAVAGGLVAWSTRRTPVFCADAVADPLSGIYAALGALRSQSLGGGHLVDVSMAAASASVAASGPRCDRPHRVVWEPAGGWLVCHDAICQPVVDPLASAPQIPRRGPCPTSS